MQDNAPRGGQPPQLSMIWAGLLGGVIMVAAAIGFLAASGTVTPMLPDLPWWWLAVLAPLPVAALLQRRLREAEAARERLGPQALMQHYLPCWAVADAPGMIGPALGLLTGNLLLLYAGTGLAVILLLAARPDTARRT